jgi:hypothetical protein
MVALPFDQPAVIGFRTDPALTTIQKISNSKIAVGCQEK